MSKHNERNSPRSWHLHWACLALVLVALTGMVAAGSRLVQAEQPAVDGPAARPGAPVAEGVRQAAMRSTTLISDTVFLPLLQHCVSLGGVSLTGPDTGSIGMTHMLTATVSPDTSRLPITYTWRVHGQAPVVHSGGLEDVLEIRLERTGVYAIVVEATTGCGFVRAEHVLTLTTRGLVAFERHYAGEDPHDIWLLDSAGSGMEFNLTNTPDIDEGVPTWSPDGNWLAYAAGVPGGKRAIYKMDLSSGEVITLTDGSRDDRWPAWSPTGDRIAFMRNQPDLPPGYYVPDIYVMNIDGTQPRQLTTWLWADDFPAWSPDGVWIAFTRQPDDYSFTGRDLWKLDPDNPGNLIRLTNTPRPNPEEDLRDEIYPSWSADGWIYHTFAYSDGGQNESELLYRIRDDGSGREKVFDDAYDRYIPSFAPDGSCFVFYSTLGGRDGEDKEVWKWCQGFTAAVNLTDNDAGDEFCAWSPAQ